MNPAPPVTSTFTAHKFARLPGGAGGHREPFAAPLHRRIVILATKLVEPTRQPLPEDVRARRPYFLSGGPLKATARRLASMVALLALDLCGLALGVYAALAL